MKGRSQILPSLCPRDRRLFAAVRNHRPHLDGCCEVVVRGNILDVFVYNMCIFSYNRSTKFWEATNHFNTQKWMRDKLNACLYAVRAGVAVYYHNGGFYLTNATGTIGRANIFNSEKGSLA